MTQYIDPSSGAAPQPGGYAGAHAFGKGHAQPEWDETAAEENEDAPLNEAPEDTPEPKTVDEIAKAKEEAAAAQGDKSDEEQKEELVAAQSNPQQVLSDLDENGGRDDLPEPGEEELAVDRKGLETEAVNPREETEEQDEEGKEEEPEEEGDKPAAKKAAAKKSTPRKS